MTRKTRTFKKDEPPIPFHYKFYLVYWEDIQSEREDWFFRRTSGTFTTTASTQDYDLNDEIGNLREADLATFTLWETAEGEADESRLSYVDWTDWVKQYDMQEPEEGRPYLFTQTPNGDFRFYPVPDDDYTVKLYYTIDIETLSTASDSSETALQIDEFDQNRIYWLAAFYYAQYHNDERTMQRTMSKNQMHKVRMDRKYTEQPRLVVDVLYR